MPANHGMPDASNHYQPWWYPNAGKITALELDLNTTKTNLANLNKQVDTDMALQ
jgi:hypothetical protein